MYKNLDYVALQSAAQFSLLQDKVCFGSRTAIWWRNLGQAQIVERAVEQVFQGFPVHPIVPKQLGTVLEGAAVVMGVQDEQVVFVVAGLRGTRSNAKNTFWTGILIAAHHDGRSEIGEMGLESWDMVLDFLAAGNVDDLGRDAE